MDQREAGSIGRAGPVLMMQGWQEGRVTLAALLIRPEGETPGPLSAPGGEVAPERLAAAGGLVAWRHVFALPDDRPSSYPVEGVRHEVGSDLRGDLRIGYVSCNGEEHGDDARDPRERNAMWSRLAQRDAAARLNLLLHGGDQIYADEVTRAHPLTAEWPAHVPEAPAEADLATAKEAVRAELFRRYTRLYAMPGFAELAARVPSLAMWDDHDICDGWGSLPGGVCDGPVGRALFDAAREAFLVFQQGVSPAAGGDTAGSLGWRLDLPGVALLAPDLRSERRRDRVMGPQGWARMDRWTDDPALPERVLLMSSVPLLGPRLSLLERVIRLSSRTAKYEDDLRDQWQSRAHRAEWRRLLTVLGDHTERTGPVTLLSGEIHLATRGEMRLGDRVLHQLIASGISHPPPPRGFARALGALSALGEAPLPHRPITLHPLPGQRRVYAAQRNYLLLFRRGGAWSAAWELESQGRTPPLAL